MKKEQRLAYFTRLLSETKPHGGMDLWYKGARRNLPVYAIDLDFLIYNAYNGRIASLVKSHETQEGRRLDPTNAVDVKLIETFLWQSSKSSNENTKKSIDIQGQLKYGIVTKDGVIIDGNRRAMILRQVFEGRNEKPVYFLAVVLEEALDENPPEIMRLETTFQMGEDAKVDYNPIEKYLKCKDLEAHFQAKDIATMMGEQTSQIEEYLSIMRLMDDYLEKIESSGIYTRLDKTEGAFVDLNNYLDRYQKNRSRMIQWEYGESDLNDLKLIYFDYIRAIYNKSKKNEDDEGVLGIGDSKDYRFIGQTSKKGSFFSSRDIWEGFRDFHFENLDPLRENFENGDFSVGKLREDQPTVELDKILKQRDEQWARAAAPHLKRNLGTTRYKLDLKNQLEEPMDLLRRVKSTLDSIDTRSAAFLEDPNVEKIVSEINTTTYTFKQHIKQHSKKK